MPLRCPVGKTFPPHHTFQRGREFTLTTLRGKHDDRFWRAGSLLVSALFPVAAVAAVSGVHRSLRTYRNSGRTILSIIINNSMIARLPVRKCWAGCGTTRCYDPLQTSSPIHSVAHGRRFAFFFSGHQFACSVNFGVAYIAVTGLVAAVALPYFA